MTTKLLRSSSYTNAIKCTFSKAVQPVATQSMPLDQGVRQPMVPGTDGFIQIKTQNNISLITSKPDQPLSTISCIVRSGSRYEDNETLGISQLLRQCGGLKTANVTSFMHTKLLQQSGALMNVINSRECIQYIMTGIMHDNVDAAWESLTEIAMRPLFRPWELKNAVTRLKYERNLVNASFITMDLLHKAAYRSKGLGNTIITPDFMLDKLTKNDLHEFHAKTHTTDRMSIIGLGCNPDWLFDTVKTMESTNPGAQIEKSKYMGGLERRDEINRCAYVAIAWNGANIGGPDYPNLLVAQHIMGGTFTKYGIDPCSKLAGLLTKSTGTGEAYTINVNYSDSGLFGFFLILEPNNVEKAVKEIYAGFQKVKMTDEDLKGAKARAKLQFAVDTDSVENQAEWLSTQCRAEGGFYTMQEVSDAIDKVTVSSVQASLKKVFSTKVSMSTYGNIADVPYVDSL